LSGKRKNRRVVVPRFIEAGDKMGAAGSGCSATDTEPTSELCLARSRERGPLFVADADPLDFAVADSISDRMLIRLLDKPASQLDSDPLS
jgi:hypothetical protein